MPERVFLRRAAGSLLLLAAATGCASYGIGGFAAPVPPVTPPQPDAPSLATLAIPVSAAENRAVSFSNGRSAYYYTQTHRNDHPEHAWFRGLNLAGRRIFNDYQLRVGDATLDPAAAQAEVRPDVLLRRYSGGVVETLRLFDQQDVVEVGVSGASAPAELRLFGDQLRADGDEGALHWYVSTSGEGAAATVDHVVSGPGGGGFLIAVGPTRDAAAALLRLARDSAAAWTAAREARLTAAISGEHQLGTDDARLTQALRWITLTTSELVTRQRGDGIYAGLPWFNEYWGRDSFIALPGAVLVTGHFAEARAILASFARFQELDPTSPFYGRLPNIVKPGSIDYHTTDGTPRWVIALRDYLRYSGDRSAVDELYPNVKASIEGSLAHWTDASGYLLHADNETWMDARREPDHASYSPRATRANDIQALWYQQLQAGSELARMRGDTVSAVRWEAAARRVRAAFARDYVDPAGARIADRLDAQGTADFTLRPNLFFALDLVDDSVAVRATRRAWEALVYPWGVATLDQDHPFFHPYHVAWEHYHKDEAYHNGAVWPWLNGIAMQRLLERGQSDPAWRLFQDMNEIALTRGVVGGLPENLDAYPHPGEAAPRLTGTFLQAWSNSEQLRIWYQYLLGIRPDLACGEVLLAPRLPRSFGAADVTVRLGGGTLRMRATRAGEDHRLEWRLDGLAATLLLDLPGYEVVRYAAESGEVLSAEAVPGGMRVRLQSAQGAIRADAVLHPTAARRAQQASWDAALGGLRFAAPRDPLSHPVMHQVYQRQ